MIDDEELLDAIVSMKWTMEYCNQRAFFRGGDTLTFEGFIIANAAGHEELIITNGEQKYGTPGSRPTPSFEVYPGQRVGVVNGVVTMVGQVRSGGGTPHTHPVRLDFYCINHRLKLEYTLLEAHGSNHNDYGGGTGN